MTEEKVPMQAPSASRADHAHTRTLRTNFSATSLLTRMAPAATLALLMLLLCAVSAQAASLASPTPPPLGAAQNFAVLAGTTVTNTGPTAITGDLGISPGTACTGLPSPCTGGGPGTVNGTIHSADTAAGDAQAALTTAYNQAAAAGPATTVATELGGTTPLPGVYDSEATDFQITGTLTLNGHGNLNATWIFQTASTLVTASASHVVLENGAQACHVFWKVGSSATLGTNSSFVGNILALTSITVTTGVTVDGRVLARNGAVTLDTDTIQAAQCGVPGNGGAAQSSHSVAPSAPYGGCSGTSVGGSAGTPDTTCVSSTSIRDSDGAPVVVATSKQSQSSSFPLWPAILLTLIVVGAGAVRLNMRRQRRQHMEQSRRR